MTPADRYDSLTQYYAGLKGVDWLLMKAQQRRESAFQPYVKSRAGALGLTQFMPKTWTEFCQEHKDLPDLMDPKNPEMAICAQVWLMARLIADFQDIRYALAAYNWGSGSVKKLKAKMPGQSFETHVRAMPQETQDYVRTILTYYDEYRRSGNVAGMT